MKLKGKQLEVHATTGVAESAYGGNVYLRLEAESGDRSLARERLLAAATYRAAAAIEEWLLGQSTCAVCVEAHDGRIHLEFGERATQAEQDAARGVLDVIADEINRSGRPR